MTDTRQYDGPAGDTSPEAKKAAKEEATQVASIAVEQGKETASVAADAASQTVASAAESTKQVASTAAEQVKEVTRQAPTRPGSSSARPGASCTSRPPPRPIGPRPGWPTSAARSVP